MSSLYFAGIKKSRLKKIPPFKFYFEWRDKKNYEQISRQLKENIEEVAESESILSHTLNERELKLLFRKFPCSDLSVLQQVFVENCYEPIVKKMLEHYSPNESLKIVDAGANVGFSSIYFNTYFPYSEIIAIEPEEKNVQQLKKNIALNNLQLKELIKGALWYQTAFLEVSRDFRDNRDASITVKEAKMQTDLEGYSFVQVLEKNNWDEADLVKIDIEGGERFLFDTDEKADAILNRTKFLAIEIHDEFNIRNSIYDHLKRNGFNYFESGDLTLAVNKNKVSAPA